MNERNHEQDDLKKKYDNLYQYVKNVTGIYRNLSSTFMVVSLTAFIFLLSVGYPDLLDVYIIICSTAIKAISFSLVLLVCSFFLFLISTFIYLYKSIKVNTFYFYEDSELSLTERYLKLDKLANLLYVGMLLFTGLLTLIGAVFFMLIYFSAAAILFAVILILIIGIYILIFIFFTKIKKIRKILKRFFKK